MNSDLSSTVIVGIFKGVSTIGTFTYHLAKHLWWTILLFKNWCEEFLSTIGFLLLKIIRMIMNICCPSINLRQKFEVDGINWVLAKRISWSLTSSACSAIAEYVIYLSQTTVPFFSVTLVFKDQKILIWASLRKNCFFYMHQMLIKDLFHFEIIWKCYLYYSFTWKGSFSIR